MQKGTVMSELINGKHGVYSGGNRSGPFDTVYYPNIEDMKNGETIKNTLHLWLPCCLFLNRKK
jgi:hypothetical protein